ncbi:hypothetical protein Ddc_02566 [Ditylenchus destructor]|nr:hypothetical protein Ddc_02566 [Ditylenchus destructor]
MCGHLLRKIPICGLFPGVTCGPQHLRTRTATTLADKNRGQELMTHPVKGIKAEILCNSPLNSSPASLVLSLLSQLLALNFKLRQETMGAAVVLLLVVAIAAGAAYHLGYLDVYVEQAKQKINEAQQKQQ